MEDAMIINKSSLERGFTHGTVYKSEVSSKQRVSDYCMSTVNSTNRITRMTVHILPHGTPNTDWQIEENHVFSQIRQEKIRKTF